MNAKLKELLSEGFNPAKREVEALLAEIQKNPESATEENLEKYQKNLEQMARGVSEFIAAFPEMTKRRLKKGQSISDAMSNPASRTVHQLLEAVGAKRAELETSLKKLPEAKKSQIKESAEKTLNAGRFSGRDVDNINKVAEMYAADNLEEIAEGNYGMSLRSQSLHPQLRRHTAT